MLKKNVIFVGITGSNCVSSHLATLVVGKRYEVTGETMRGDRRLYTLKGVVGRFDSRWFQRLDTKPYFVAVAPYMPAVGEHMVCYVLTGGREETIYSTSLILYIKHLSCDIYCVYTMNSVYFVRCKGANPYEPDDTCVFLDTTVGDLFEWDPYDYEERFDKRTCYDSEGHFKYRSVSLVRIDKAPVVGKCMRFTCLDPDEGDGVFKTPKLTAVDYVGNQLFLLRAGHQAFIAYLGD